MKQRYASWASRAAVAAIIMTACGDGANATGHDAIHGAAGTGGSGGGATAPAGSGGTNAGAAGAMAPGGAGGANAGGDPMGGTGGDPMGGAGGDDPTGGTGAAPQGACAPASSVDEDGPFTPTHIENGGARGTSWVFYPKELGRDGMLHPVFNWGPGAGTGPREYTDHLNRLASHGFVVISQPSSGNGDTERASLTWLLAENERAGSDFYQKLDPTKVGAGGHSLGALTTMAMADDDRLGLYVLVCGGCMSGRGGCGAADIHAPTVILGGDTDTGTPNFEGDYAEITAPVVFLTKSNTGHIACARNNLAPWVAFMRWQLCGEDAWKPKFLAGGEFCSSPWTCKSKGF